jgi:hypothetical protein
MGLIDCPKLLVTNYQSTVCNIPEESRSHLHQWGKSEIMNDSVHTVHVGIRIGLSAQYKLLPELMQYIKCQLWA